MGKYEEAKRQKRIDSKCDIAYYRFIQLFYDVPINRQSIENIFGAINSAVEIADNLRKDIDVLSVYERRLPEIWFKLVYNNSEYIISTNGTSDVQGILFEKDNEWRCVSGSMKDISKYIQQLDKNETIKSYPYEITEYTKFMASIEAVHGIDFVQKDLIRNKVISPKELTETIMNKEEDYLPLLKFIKYLYNRMYYRLLTTNGTESNGYVFSLDDTMKLIFNPKIPGESGVRVMTICGDTEKDIRIIDDMRELECFINTKAEITGNSNN